MTLTIDLTPQAEAWLNAEAQQRGLRPKDLALRVIEERAATSVPSTQPAPVVDAENAAAIAYLERKMKEDATDDPEALRKADEEVEELKRNLNANRAAGERLVFPDEAANVGASFAGRSFDDGADLIREDRSRFGKTDLRDDALNKRLWRGRLGRNRH